MTRKRQSSLLVIMAFVVVQFMICNEADSTDNMLNTSSSIKCGGLTSPLHLSEFRKLTALFPDFSKLVFFFFLAGFNASVVALLAFLVPPLLWTGALLFPVLSAMLTDCLALLSKVAVVSTSSSPSSREKSPLSRPLSLVKDVSLSAKNRNKTSYNFIPFHPCTK